MKNCYGTLLLLISCAAVAFAGNGKIVGTVRDASTNDPIVGGNVMVVGTKLGGMVDAQGRYYILNIPPGEYSLRTSSIGSSGKTIANVIVRADQTAEVDFTLAAEAVQIREVLVRAEMRVVDKSQTSSRSTIGRDEFNGTLPTTTEIEMLNTTPGAYKGFVRGGRITETKTIVEGVDVTDQYYAVAAEQTYGLLGAMGITRNKSSQLSTNTSVTFGAVEQMSVQTGATGAEHGQATAGIINYSLKEGRGELNGSVYARLSQFNGLKYLGPNLYWNDSVYFSAANALGAKIASGKGTQADSVKLQKYTYTRDKYNSQIKPQIELEGTVGGEIMEDFGIFVAGRYIDSHERLPNERTREADMTVKMNYNLTPQLKLLAFGIMNDQGRFLGWKNSTYYDNSRFFLEGVPRNDGGSIVASIKGTHVLSPSTFYELQFSTQNRQNRLGFVDGNNDGIIGLNEDGDFLTLETTAEADRYISSPSNQTKAFRYSDEAAQNALDIPLAANNTQVFLARPRFAYEKVQTNVSTAKFDFTSQLDFNNQIKGGAQLRYHTISKIGRYSLLNIDAVDLRRKLFVEQWSARPTEFGAYISDRMEYANLVINLGVRLDRWNPDIAPFANDFLPWVKDTVMIDDSARVDYFPRRADSKVAPSIFFSPRIGVSHPISDEAAMFFSYSHNTMPAPFSRIYTAYNSILGQAGNSNPLFLASTEPTRSSNYELGVQWEFDPQLFGLTFTAYMRDIENYSTQSVGLTTSGAANLIFSSQYADARGIELSIQALRQDLFDGLTVQGRLNYAYTYIKASAWAGLDANQQTSFSGLDSLKNNNQLPLTDFAYYNKVQYNVVGGNSNLTGGYDRTHRLSYVLLMNLPYDINVSSIGTFQSGFQYPLQYTIADVRIVGRTLASSPWNKQIDFHIEKRFTFQGVRLSLFADVKNAFNWVNIVNYDNTTTGAEMWERSAAGESGLVSQGASSAVINGTPDPTGTQHRAVSPDGTMFYDIPREVYFGVKVDF